MIHKYLKNPFYILVVSFFIFLTAPTLLTEGMVMDGVLYASISRNMAMGLGSFWKPYLSEGLFPEFYEHPPLAIGLQSIGFKIFGDSIYVERFYSLFTYILLGLIIVAIWKQFTHQYKWGWIPLLFFFSMLKIPWACANNLLENTMSVFIGLSVLFYLKSLKNQSYFLVILSGLFLFFATLTKGFVGLYVWGLPFFMGFLNRKLNFKKVFLHTLSIVGFTVLPLLLLIWVWPAAAEFFNRYISGQVLGSIKDSVTVEHRFFIVQAVIYHSLPVLFMVGGIMLVAWIKKIDFRFSKIQVNNAISLFLLAAGGILPITVSLKQSGHYAITVYPYIALASALLVYPIIEEIFHKVKFLSHTVLLYVSYFVLASALVFSVAQFGKYRYQKEIVTDCKEIIERTGPNQTIGICPKMKSDWFLHGYFARYGNISLDYIADKNYTYILTDQKCSNFSLKDTYKEVELKSELYKLYKCK